MQTAPRRPRLLRGLLMVVIAVGLIGWGAALACDHGPVDHTEPAEVALVVAAVAAVGHSSLRARRHRPARPFAGPADAALAPRPLLVAAYAEREAMPPCRRRGPPGHLGLAVHCPGRLA